MRFKTTIEIITEASDKNEAAEIAGEYISGNLSSGVRMICRTRQIMHLNKKIAGGAALAVLAIAVVLLAAVHIRASKNSPPLTGGYALQPPLKTFSESDKRKADFRKEWTNAETRRTLKPH